MRAVAAAVLTLALVGAVGGQTVDDGTVFADLLSSAARSDWGCCAALREVPARNVR